jgi:serine/threonine protein kinase
LALRDQIGDYEVLSLLGKDGMREVWKARNAKLDGQIAIKVLPDALAHDPDRLARFECEDKGSLILFSSCRRALRQNR